MFSFQLILFIKHFFFVASNRIANIILIDEGWMEELNVGCVGNRVEMILIKEVGGHLPRGAFPT